MPMTEPGSTSLANINTRQVNADSTIKQNKDEWYVDTNNVALVDKQGKALIKRNPR